MLSYSDLQRLKNTTSVLSNYEQNNKIFVTFVNFPLKCILSPVIIAFIWPFIASSFIIASWDYRKQT